MLESIHTKSVYQATRPHSSIALALAASEATGHLQTGHYCLQVAARQNLQTTDCQLIADSGNRCLRSADNNALTVPQTNTRLGDRSLTVEGAKVWSSHPATLRTSDFLFLMCCV